MILTNFYLTPVLSNLNQCWGCKMSQSVSAIFTGNCNFRVFTDIERKIIVKTFSPLTVSSFLLFAITLNLKSSFSHRTSRPPGPMRKVKCWEKCQIVIRADRWLMAGWGGDHGDPTDTDTDMQEILLIHIHSPFLYSFVPWLRELNLRFWAESCVSVTSFWNIFYNSRL